MSEVKRVEIVKIYPTACWIEDDIMGARHLMLQHEGMEPFCYASFHYSYAYTSNAGTHDAAHQLAAALGFTEPIEHRVRSVPEPSDDDLQEVIALIGADKLRAALGVQPSGVTLSTEDAHFLAVRLRRLCGHLNYTLPQFASDDAALVNIAGTVIGALLTNMTHGVQPARTRKATDAEVLEWAKRHDLDCWDDLTVARQAFEDAETHHLTRTDGVPVAGKRLTDL
jgi:hypothetical protein